MKIIFMIMTAILLASCGADKTNNLDERSLGNAVTQDIAKTSEFGPNPEPFIDIARAPAPDRSDDKCTRSG